MGRRACPVFIKLTTLCFHGLDLAEAAGGGRQNAGAYSVAGEGLCVKGGSRQGEGPGTNLPRVGRAGRRSKGNGARRTRGKAAKGSVEVPGSKEGTVARGQRIAILCSPH